MLFQRPKRASFISTEFVELRERNVRRSFNALNGLLSFLLWKRRQNCKWTFQRPKRASFISTKFLKLLRFLKCFNALNGLLSFLLLILIIRSYLMKCFNALNGLLSFLPSERRRQAIIWSMFQRPKRASFISTSVDSYTVQDRYDVFQRPKRASFISTPWGWDYDINEVCFNALNGLLSFLPEG